MNIEKAREFIYRNARLWIWQEGSICLKMDQEKRFGGQATWEN